MTVGYIYKITSPSKRIYIGQTINWKNRRREYNGKGCVQQTRLYASFLKYGVDKHLFEIVTECDQKDLNIWERYYQDLYGCIGRKGLNCKLTNYGDRSGGISEETRHRMSSAQKIAQSGKARIGMKHSDETKDKIRMKALGRIPHNLGIKASEETKQKLRKPKTKEHARKSALGKVGKRTGAENHKSKLVLNTETGIYYDCAKAASISTNIAHSTMRSKLNGNKVNRSSFVYA